MIGRSPNGARSEDLNPVVAWQRASRSSREVRAFGAAADLARREAAAGGIHCSSVNRTDMGFLRPQPFLTRFWSGLARPRHNTLGCEFAGEVDVAGGGHAEHKVVAQGRSVTTIPEGLTLEQPPRARRVRTTRWSASRGEGSGGGGGTGAIGSAAVQLLEHAGAYVLASSTTRNVELVESR
jgi:NADPH:quinone reductase-like Zn-dependent oxidoreductase